jgi:hypothetical protein
MIVAIPIHRQTEARKPTVDDDEILIGHNHSRLVLQRWRDAFDQVKQAFPPGRDMCAVLDIV